MKWTIKLLEDAERELLAMPPDIQARFLHVAELLEHFGPQQVGMPHIRHLDGKLWEMRLSGKDGIARAIYIAQAQQRLVVLHIFIKKSQKTPRKALEMARARLQRLKP